MGTNNDTKEPQGKKWFWVYFWNIVIWTLIFIPLSAGVEWINNKITPPPKLIDFWPDLLIKHLGSIIIGIVVGILTGTAKVLYDTVKDLSVAQSVIKEQVCNAIKDNLPTIFSKHKINITGVHRGKPDGALLIANAELFHRTDSGGKPKDYLDGLLIMEHHAFANHYASHCEKVIEHNGIKSIYSMSDFGLDLTFHMFCEEKHKDNQNVIDWIQTVNDVGSAKIKRIQVLTQWRYQFLKKLIAYQQDDTKWKDLINYVRPSIKKDYEKDSISLSEDQKNAKKLAENLVNGYEWYCNNYSFVTLDKDLANGEIKETNPHVNWAIFTRESIEQGGGIKIKEVTPGEFIIFNEDVLVRYSEDSRLSETLNGSIVDPFLIAFTDTGCWEEQIGLRPLFFGQGNYDKSAKMGKYYL